MRHCRGRPASSGKEGVEAGATAGAGASGRGRVPRSQGVLVQSPSGLQGAQDRELLFQEGKLSRSRASFLRGDQVERNTRRSFSAPGRSQGKAARQEGCRRGLREIPGNRVGLGGSLLVVLLFLGFAQ